MKRRLAGVFVATFALVAASSACANQDSAPRIGDGEFDTGPLPRLDSAVQDAAQVDSGALDAESTETDAIAEPLCAKAYSDVTPTFVDHPRVDGGGERLAAITWDERTMVWTTTETGAVVVHYADRVDRDAPFTDVRALPTELGPFPEDKVALSADGLKMIFTSEDHTTISEIKRTARSEAFDVATIDRKPYARLVGGGKRVGDLVLSRDGKWLFYSELDRTSGASIFLSIALGDGTWDAPNPIDTPRLTIEAGFRRRPTGLSADARSLFFFDEVSEVTFVAFRAPDTLLFTEFYGFAPTGRGAMPSESCDRVYLTIEVPDSSDAGTKDAPETDDPPVTTTIVYAP